MSYSFSEKIEILDIMALYLVFQFFTYVSGIRLIRDLFGADKI